MPAKSLPQSPSLDHLKSQALDLKRALLAGDEPARRRFQEHLPHLQDRLQHPASSSIRLAHAQLIVAREYGFPSWPKLKAHVESAQLKSGLDIAIRENNLAQVSAILDCRPQLLNEPVVSGNWGRPLVYAAQCGHLDLVKWLRARDRGDLQHALSRAAMKAHTEVMDYLIAEGADPAGPYAEGMGDSYGPVILSVLEALNSAGLEALLERGASLTWKDSGGNQYSPLPMLLGTYTREPRSKHACLATCARYGLELPPTAPMAVHLGRRDLLQQHLDRDAKLFSRHYTLAAIYPIHAGSPSWDAGNADPLTEETAGLHGAPLKGATLLHLAVEMDDLELASWMLGKGANPNVRSAIDRNGLGGLTPLFHAVVTLGKKDDGKARMLLDAGADPLPRATFRKQLQHMGDADLERDILYHDVTPVEFAEQFPWKPAVCEPAVELLRNAAARSH